LEGHHRHTVYDGTLPHPYAITIFEDTIYWTDWNTRTVEKGNKYDGSNRVVLVNTTHRPFDIHVYHPYRQPIGESVMEELGTTALGSVNVIVLFLSMGIMVSSKRMLRNIFRMYSFSPGKGYF
jgi:hypothetical protein